MLRTGLRLQNIDKCDEIWLTCCALHNRLLFIDGLHKNWEVGVPSNWEKDQRQKNYITPFAVSRINTPSFEEVLADSNELQGNTNLLDLSKYEIDGFRIVSMLPQDIFKDLLVENFDIRFKKGDIKWPARIKTSTGY